MTSGMPSRADAETLARQLESDPLTIGNPAVLEQLRWLKALANFEDLPAQLRPLVSTRDGIDYLNEMLGQGARTALSKVVGAWVHGMLPTVGVYPGCTIQFIKLPKRRGRKSPVNRCWEESRLLNTYCWLRSRLQRLEQRAPLALKRRRHETRDAWVERMAREVVQKVHADSWLRELHPFVRRGLSEFGVASDGAIVGVIDPSERPILTAPLPSEVAGRIAGQAFQRRADKNAILYGLLGFYEGRTPGQIRGLIEDTFAERPHAFRNLMATFNCEP